MLNDHGTLSRRIAAALFGAALLVPAIASAQDLNQPWPTNVPFGTMDHDPNADEIILDMDDSLSDEEAKAIAAKFGLKAELNSAYSDAPNIYVARVAEGAVPALRKRIEASEHADDFEIIEENIDYSLPLGAQSKAFDVPAQEDAQDTQINDPLYRYQWNFKQVNAEGAWGTSTGRDVVVAVIDTGVAVESKGNVKAARDLQGTQTVPGYDFVGKSSFVYDGHGHGTHVAGTIAQTTNNKFGVAGLAYNAKIMGLRVLNDQGFGQVSDIADSIRFAADNGAQVINMSLGGPLPSLVMKRAIMHAHKKGVTIIAAAGNGGRRAASYPAAYDHVVAVAATQYDRGTTFYSQWGKFVDIAAPGGNTRVDQDKDGRPDGILQQTLKNGRTDQHDFLLYMGTSMASPHVAAGAALVISQGVTHPDKVEAILKETANTDESKNYPEQEYTERYGAGIMQVDKAVSKANTKQGGWRLLLGLLLPLLGAGVVRRKDILGKGVDSKGLLVATSALTASGLFFLPWIFGDAAAVSYLSRPLAEMDILLFGLGSHQNPLMASALLPMGAYALLGGHKKARVVALGLAFGMAAFCLSEAVLLTSDVRWIPGMDMLDRTWLVANGLFSGALGYFGLKRY